jgi:hypothetical protein
VRQQVLDFLRICGRKEKMFTHNDCIDRYTATRIAEAMNCWAGKEHRKEFITPEEVLKLTPLSTHERDGYRIYAYQWGDVTILVWLQRSGDVFVKHVCW